jgi:hypothetical protein
MLGGTSLLFSRDAPRLGNRGIGTTFHAGPL